MIRSRTLAASACLTLLASACSGPKLPLTVGVKEFPSDVILGNQAIPPAPPPPPALNLSPGFPGFIQPPPPPLPAIPLPTPSSVCPSAHPFDAPRYEAANRAMSPPVAGTYKFRNVGSLVFGDQEREYPAESDRTIRNPRRFGEDKPGSPYGFEIVSQLAGEETTTTYAVVPESAVEDEAGIFLQEVRKKRIDGSSDRFAPLPAIKIVPFPIVAGDEWDSVGTDPINAITMMIHGRIGIEVPDGPDPGSLPDLQPKARIDACGKVLDAWYVQISGVNGAPAGRIVGPGKDLALKAVFAIATQFGGISVYDQVELEGTDEGKRLVSDNEASILSEPKLPI